MKQGEIWLISLDPTVGAEIKKTRPAIVVNDDAYGKLPLKIIAPITDWKDWYGSVPWMVRLLPNGNNGLTKESAADCFQVRSLAEERFIRKMGQTDEVTLQKIRTALSLVLSIN